MKPLITLVFFAAAAPASLLMGCGTQASADPTATSSASHAATLAIAGMTCASCSVTVKIAAEKLDGLASIDVDVDAGTAKVTYDGTQVTAEQIAQKITDAGYKTTVAVPD